MLSLTYYTIKFSLAQPNSSTEILVEAAPLFVDSLLNLLRFFTRVCSTIDEPKKPFCKTSSKICWVRVQEFILQSFTIVVAILKLLLTKRKVLKEFIAIVRLMGGHEEERKSDILLTWTVVLHQ